MSFIHFIVLYLIFFNFYVNVGPTAIPRLKNSSLSILSTNNDSVIDKIEPDANKTILSSIKDGLTAKGLKLTNLLTQTLFGNKQNATEQVQIEISSEASTYQLKPNKTNSPINRNESGVTGTEELPTISSNGYETTEQVTLTINDDLTTMTENESVILKSTVDPITKNYLMEETQLTTFVTTEETQTLEPLKKVILKRRAMIDMKNWKNFSRSTRTNSK